MKACLHKKFGSVIVFTVTKGQYSWCRNCGCLVNPSTEEVITPQMQVEKVKAPKKVREAPNWEMNDDPF